jgi:hypothetical protein
MKIDIPPPVLGDESKPALAIELLHDAVKHAR